MHHLITVKKTNHQTEQSRNINNISDFEKSFLNIGFKLKLIYIFFEYPSNFYMSIICDTIYIFLMIVKW